MSPQRIQRKRTAGWRMPPDAVYVGRPSRWGNPWRIVPVRDNHFPFADAADVHNEITGASIGRFERISRSKGTGAPYWATQAFRGDLTPELIEEIRRELGGRDLACWCPPFSPCHADVLLDLANQAAS